MRRLLTWIVILMTSASALLVGVRAAHPDSSTTACVQLLSPITGDVLTVDANSGTALLDARHDFPLPPSRDPSLRSLSPDQTHVIDAIDVTQYGPRVYVLMSRRRSTTHRRPLDAIFNAYDYLWSPDSQNIALADLKGWGGGTILGKAVITDINTASLKTESIPFNLAGNWFSYVLWSPDGTMLAVPVNRSQSATSPYSPYLPDATLNLLPTTSAQSIRVSLPNEEIERLSWSPDSQIIFVFTHDASANYHRLHVIRRDGQVLRQVDLALGFIPRFSLARPYIIDREWSPDGQYFYLQEDDGVNQTITEIYNLNGNRIRHLPIQASNISPMWATQSHTLLYIIDHGSSQTLGALDVATGHIITLADHLETQSVDFAPNDALFVVMTSPTPNHLVPRIISRDLTQNIAPFGEINYRVYASPEWSPDSKKVVLVTEDEAEFTVMWVQTDNANADPKILHFPKKVGEVGTFYATWMTNDILLLKHESEYQTAWRLDSNLSSLVVLYSVRDLNNYYTVWNDDTYVADGSDFVGLTLYRLSDGVALFSGLPILVDGDWTPFIEPRERALLLLRGPDSQYGFPNLHLITTTSTQLLADTDNLTYAAWSPDGETFTFASIDKFQAGWTVKVMSRDGTLLRSLPLSADTANTPYQQARWTDCG